MPKDVNDGPPPPGRRRRGAALEAALLDATWEELLAVGYQELTYEGVAARAHTSRTVLYRRWPHRRDLVLAALRHRTPPLPPPVPDTGALRTDVLALLGQITARLTEITPVLEVLTDNRTRGSDLDDYLAERSRGDDGGAMAELLDRAARRGETDPSRIPARVATLPVSLVAGEMLITRQAPSQAAVTALVDDIFLPLVAHHGGTGDAADGER
ncbi:TetR/AcrR family transcriptional regulator [Streptomyces lydicus]|uniref:TetR/AcrR family transcriptional regulator n=1 Tax=Streptomyces lydicus TaxID=47763 RepID=UPI0007C4999A|nr:TetR/AcrR family transcriptional regulator [Streptomyces lydicus]MDC7336373.1 TetR/AcrR family transcriptional regulator C-terminal ligand-binding domain-containing protein [Streptomyces lydicus]UEG94308.1 TetR/AcrR family transcriptional regulator [Streptomyces lydicus]